MAKSDLQFESVKKRTEEGGCDGAVLMMTRLYESNKMSAQGASGNAMILQVHDDQKKEMAFQEQGYTKSLWEL